MLRCSLGCVRHMEKRGKLHPIIDRDGIRRFDRNEVESVGRERLRDGSGAVGVSGELAADVFRMFRDGQSFADIVIHTLASPETIRMLWDEYKRPLGSPPAVATLFADDLADSDRRARELDGEILERRRRRQQGSE